MRNAFKLFFLLLICLQVQVSFSQKDTSFWFSAPEVSFNAGTEIYLRFLTYDNAATVSITQPANGLFVPIVLNIPGNTVDSVDLTALMADVESVGGNVISDNGLKIVASDEVSIFFEVTSPGNREVFSLKGIKGTGTNFYTPFQSFFDHKAAIPANFSSVNIVATEDNTTVLITPTVDIVGHVKNVSFSVVLNAGETYEMRDTEPRAETNMSGSRVASDKPIAVTVFNGAVVNSAPTCISSIGDQITSVDHIGTDFVLHKTNALDERVYILAVENNTNISIENSSSTNTVINWGETYEYALADDINYIETDKPVYVWHIAGNDCRLSGAQVPNLFCAGTNSTAFTRTSSDSLRLVLYTRSGFEGMFAINGNASLIPAVDFVDVPGTSGEFKAAFIGLSLADVPLNSYNEVTNTGDIFGMAVLAGQNSTSSGYAYFSEFDSDPSVDPGSDDNVCANDSFLLSGSVGGGSITGSWSTTGFGSFQNDLTDLDNVYIPSDLDTIISPINIILTSSGPCPVIVDTLVLDVNPAPLMNASVDQLVCANNLVIQLDGSASGGASTGIWSTTGTGAFTPNDSALAGMYLPSSDDSIAGNVSLILTSTNFGTCNATSDTMEVTFTPAPVVDAGVDSVFVCANNPNVDLVGTVTGGTTTGKWTTAGNGIFSPDNLTLISTYQSSFADVDNGSVTLYLTSTVNGNCIAVEDSLIAIFTSAPMVDAGANVVACSNANEIELNGAVSGFTNTGIWSGGSGTFSPNDSTLNATYSPSAEERDAGIVALTLTSTNNDGCAGENDNMQINFVAAPLANFDFTEVCAGGVTEFTDFSLPGFGNIISWEWDFGDAAFASTQNTSNTYSQSGSYTVQQIVVTDLGCSDTTAQVVEVFEIPEADFSFVLECNELNQQVVDFTDASSISSGSIDAWLYEFGGQGASAVQNPSQLFVGSGDFTVRQVVTSQGGCVDSIEKTLTIPLFPEADFFFNNSNVLNVSAEFSFFDNSSNATSYNWSFGNGDVSQDKDPITLYNANGAYTVTQHAYNSIGCVDSISKVITVSTIVGDSDIEILIPNAISPNGDDKNDIWKLPFIQFFPGASVEIYNRWGQQLFFSEDYTKPWDGTYQGDVLPDETYYYVINLNDVDKTVFKGSILILKEAN